MSEPTDRDADDEPVPLAQAGLTKTQIEAQLDKLSHSEALENKGAEKKILEHLVRQSFAGKVALLRAQAITRVVFPNEDPGSSHLRKDTNKLREHLDEYYASEAKPGGIRFTIPEGQYVVHSPKTSTPIPDWRAGKPGIPPVARILEPVTGAEVQSRVTIRGRIDSLDLDLRAWLVVRTGDDEIHPQIRLSRNSPDWEGSVRIGRLDIGIDDGGVFEIALVATDSEGDYAFRQYLKSDRNGYGMGRLLPGDCAVLDIIRVIRRDIPERR